MKVWDEEYVVRQLAAARKKASNSEEGKQNTKPDESPIEFLLVLVRKFAHKNYEFIYIPGNCYERVEQVYNETSVVLTHAVADDGEDDKEYGVWIGRSSDQESDGDDDDDDEDDNNESGNSFKIHTSMESHYVGKAIFHTASGEPLMKIEASAGWKEAIKQKFVNLDAKSRYADKKKQDENNHTAAKAVAAAALGGGAAAGATSVVAASTAAAATTAAIEAGTAYGAGAFAATGGFGAAYGGAGYGAASGLGYGAASYGAGYGAAGYGAGYGAAGYGAGAGTWASWAAANGVATSGASAGGFGATASTTAAAGVMAPVGAIAAVGAVGGLGIYYVLHRRNQAKKAREQVIKEGVPTAEKLHEEDSTVVTEENSSCEGEPPSGYLPLTHDHEVEEPDCGNTNLWLSLFAKRVDDDDNHCVFVPVVCCTRADAERELQHQATNNIAKALFNPEGKVLQIDVDPADHDGWETALALHYDFLEDHNVLSSHRYEEDTEEDAPLLDEDHQALQKHNGANSNQTNWVLEAIRKKRQQLGNIQPGKILNLRANRASA